MSLNLHAAVRGAITSVVPDITAQWQQSTGYTTSADGSQVPTYAAAQSVPIQVQPLSKSDLRHVEMLNLEGVFRVVYGFNNAQGVNRPSQMGGDLFTFAQEPGGTPQVWLVTDVPETWGTGWYRVIVCLQTDVIT